MRRRTFTPVAPALAGTVPVATSAEPAWNLYARPGRTVRIEEGRPLNLRCTGRGLMTLLLESGLGFPS